jgi:Na+/H+-translocating membrane pyrophosphatase
VCLPLNSVLIQVYLVIVRTALHDVYSLAFAVTKAVAITLACNIAVHHSLFIPLLVMISRVGSTTVDAILRYTYTAITTTAITAAVAATAGSATNIIYGLALGYKSVIIPVFVLAAIIYVSFDLCETYGVALAAIGMLATLATGLTIDAYGPVCDNAGTSLTLYCATI